MARARSSPFVISAAVAVLYAALGILTVRLSQLTGIASPVWPSAGVAFAAALRCRWRALPGVFLGSAIATSVSVLWLTGADRPEPRTWFVAAAVGIGATLGAAAGSALVHRFVGAVQRLDTPRAVILTLILGGLVATTIAPTVGVTAQLTAGLLSPGQVALGWLTWWVGDAIGVIVVGPLALMFVPSQTEYWSGRRWQIAIPSVVIFGILIAAIDQNLAVERGRAQAAADRLGNQAAAELIRNIALHQGVLEGLRGLFDASDSVSAKEFATYTDDVLMGFPNLQALSWDPVVKGPDLASFEARQRTQTGFSNFRVTQLDAAGDPQPVTPRPEYVVVAYIEPRVVNRGALGFDILSDPVRAAALSEARDTGRPMATTPVDLVQGSGDQKGMLALLPVYEGGFTPGSESARRAALRGFAVGVYRLSDLLAETYRDKQWDGIEVKIVDVTEREKPLVIADFPARNAPQADQSAPTATTAPIDIYGRAWELSVHPVGAGAIDTRNGLVAILLLAALAVTLLLEAFLLVISGMESLARRLLSELRGAARYVASILPGELDQPLPVDSRYIPSEQLGGDSFDYRWIDDDHLIAYLVDVSGHGVAPAMLSVSVHNLLRSGTIDTATLQDPGRVLTELNRLFQMGQQDGNYFTIWYGVYQASTRTIRYSGAGHPPAIILTADGSDPVLLESQSVPIGVMEESTFETRSRILPPKCSLLIYSDGTVDLDMPGRGNWTLDDFIDLCARTARSPQWNLDDLVDDLRNRAVSGRFDDDCTLVRVTIP